MGLVDIGILTKGGDRKIQTLTWVIYQELFILDLFVSFKNIAFIHGLNRGRIMETFEMLFTKVFKN